MYIIYMHIMTPARNGIDQISSEDLVGHGSWSCCLKKNISPKLQPFQKSGFLQALELRCDFANWIEHVLKLEGL